MGKFFAKMERKYGKYAIRNLSLILIICYAIGYLLQFTMPTVLQYLTLNPYLVLHGQIWRLFTWILIPPSGFNLFTLIMLYFYYSIGTTLENTWGTFRYNVYLFSGMLFTIIGAFVLYGIGLYQYSDIGNVIDKETFFTFSNAIVVGSQSIILPGVWFNQISTYYVNMSIFLAFAATFPNVQVLLMYIIPIKVKILGILYAVMLAYEFIIYGMSTRIVILASLLNFIIFFFTTRNFKRVSPAEIRRKAEYQKKVKRAQNTGNTTQYQGKSVITRHKCAICGRTELDDPTLEFRFCSKCDGNYEYCMDHLYTHEHVKRIVPEER